MDVEEDGISCLDDQIRCGSCQLGVEDGSWIESGGDCDLCWRICLGGVGLRTGELKRGMLVGKGDGEHGKRIVPKRY